MSWPKCWLIYFLPAVLSSKIIVKADLLSYLESKNSIVATESVLGATHTGHILYERPL